MRKFVAVLFVPVFMFSGLSVTAYAADCAKNTPIDQVVDWFATLGKKDIEKDRAVAKRKANRVLACAKREARKAAKEAQKVGNEMKKKLGF